jgi:hypothetical protein
LIVPESTDRFPAIVKELKLTFDAKETVFPATPIVIVPPDSLIILLPD